MGKIMYTKIWEEEESKGGGGKSKGAKCMSHEGTKETKRKDQAKANAASKAGQKKAGAVVDMNQP